MNRSGTELTSSEKIIASSALLLTIDVGLSSVEVPRFLFLSSFFDFEERLLCFIRFVRSVERIVEDLDRCWRLCFICYDLSISLLYWCSAFNLTFNTDVVLFFVDLFVLTTMGAGRGFPASLAPAPLSHSVLNQSSLKGFITVGICRWDTTHSPLVVQKKWWGRKVCSSISIWNERLLVVLKLQLHLVIIVWSIGVT